MKGRFFIAAQYAVPQHLLSRIIGKIAASEIGFIKKLFIHLFARKFGISLDEAEREDFDDYHSFNDFFCRSLKPEARPIDPSSKAIVSPADGCFSQLGKLEGDRIFQAKGQTFTTEELLANSDLAKHFEGGDFATIYLSPKDYHRVHMPISGTLTSMTYVPGDLFSVNPTTAENVPRVFARNERAVAMFDTEVGPVAAVLVGAMIVAGIETVWAGSVAPSSNKCIVSNQYDGSTKLEKGDEMGRFKLGSTVVLLFPKDTIKWDDYSQANAAVRMGEKIAEIIAVAGSEE